MSSLKYTPAVCVAGDNYQIIYRTDVDEISHIKVDGKKYRDQTQALFPRSAGSTRS